MSNIYCLLVLVARATGPGPVAVRGAARERRPRREPDAHAGAHARPDLGRGAPARHLRPAEGRPSDLRMWLQAPTIQCPSNDSGYACTVRTECGS